MLPARVQRLSFNCLNGVGTRSPWSARNILALQVFAFEFNILGCYFTAWLFAQAMAMSKVILTNFHTIKA